MQTYEIIVSGRAVHANSADTTLVRTSIGIDKIHVLFDNTEWTAFPVRVTFANGDTIISTSLTLTEIDAPEWAAEAECTIPWEVIQDLGGIRITFQGTDASGNHIITEASGEPLSVVEAGDVGSGTVPSPAPSVDEWNQAYANAMAAANSASGAAESATEAAERANTAAAEAEQVLADGIPLMDDDTRGGAKLGDGLEVDENEALNAKVGGDISIDGNGAISYELPIMSATQHGGATLGSGLRVDDGALSLGDLVQSASGAEVVTDGCAIYSVDGEGWATQDGTPTPDNPVEIEVCRGRNLYKPDIDVPKSNCTVAVDEDTLVFSASGTDIFLGTHAVAGVAYSLASYGRAIQVRPSTKYTLALGNSVFAKNYVMFWGSDNVCLGNSGVLSSNASFTTPANTAFITIRIGYGSATSGTTYRTTVQINEGDQMPYVPYGCVGLEVQGRNLLNVHESPSNTGNCNVSLVGDDVTLTCTGNNYAYTQWKVSGFSPGSKYTVSGSFTNGLSEILVLGSSTGNIIESIGSSGGSCTFTATQGTYWIRFKLATAATVGMTSTFSYALVESGSTSTLYEPYSHTTTPIPLPTKGFAASLPDGTADALTVDSAGRWEWVNESDEVVFDGSETWGVSNAGASCWTAVNGIKKAASASIVANGLCNRFIAASADNTWNSGKGGTSDIGACFSFDHVNTIVKCADGTGTMTIAAWTSWLSTHNVTVLYPLATPTTEHGYIDLPALPSGATVSCPELDEIGCSWFVDGCEPIVEHISNERKRTEEALSDVYEAIADL